MAFSNTYRKQDPLAVRPGELRHRVTIQSPRYEASPQGASVSPVNWDDVCTAPAAIYTAGSRETSMASQLVSEVSHVVKIRWPNLAIKPNYRVVFGAQIFTIQVIENVLERNRVLLLYCAVYNGGAQ